MDIGSGRSITFECAPVTKPLLAVSGILAKGHRVVFDPRGSEIQLCNGDKIKLKEEKGAFVADFDVNSEPGPLTINPVEETTSGQGAVDPDVPMDFQRQAVSL